MKSKIFMLKSLCAVGVALTVGLASTASADIVWDTSATTISADTDVSTNGTLEYAYSFAEADQTVNGVIFTAAGAGNFADFGGDTNVTTTVFNNDSSDVYSSEDGGAPFDSLSSSYQNIISGGAFGAGTDTTISLNNLTVGQEYEVQFWLQDGRNLAVSQSRNATVGGVTIDYNDNADTGANQTHNGGVGQFIVGTFTADAAFESFTITSATPQLNAIQLRAISAVPEPSSMVLIGLGSLFLVSRRRRV